MRKLEGRKCLGDQKKSFAELPDAKQFLRVRGERVFQQPRLLSPSILQTAEARNPDSKHAGLFRIPARLAPIDSVQARVVSEKLGRERIVQLHDAIPHHIREVRSTVVEPYTAGPSSVSQNFPSPNLTKGRCEKPRSIWR